MNKIEFMKKLKFISENPEIAFNDKQLHKEIDEYITRRIEVLESVKAILTFPADGTASTQQVAWFYKVDKKVINSLVFSNLDELIIYGYTDGVFTRSAILRVGMLLVDNEIANEVMEQLLNYV